MEEKMQVIILCGGMGTRLREETEFKPKPMLEIGGVPILCHIMKIYSRYGYRDFTLCLGYKGEQIKHYFLNYLWLNNDVTVDTGEPYKVKIHTKVTDERWRVTLVDTGSNAMTGARVKRVEPYVSTNMFLLTYGDGVADIDLDALVRFHKGHGRIGTITGIRPISRFGELAVHDKRVERFNEKTQEWEHLINGGFFVFDRRLFDYVEDDDGCSLEGRPLEKLALDGQLMVYHHEGFWQCMDTYRDYKLLNDLCEGGKPPWER